MAGGARIRLYRDGDFLAVRAMLNALQEAECAMEPNRVHWSDRGAAYADWMFAEVAQHSGAVFIAEAADESMVGLATCWRAEDEVDITVEPAARVHLYVSEMFVIESWRGKGVAGALLDAVEEHGRKIGVPQITIGSLAVNAPARRAYAKAGFAEYEILLRKLL